MYVAEPSQIIVATQSLGFYWEAISDCIECLVLLRINLSPRIAQVLG